MRLQLIKNFNKDCSDIVTTVETITTNYTKELDECIQQVRLLLQSEDDISPAQLNHYVSLIPVLLYDLTAKITELGVKSDAARMQRKQVYNDAYVEQEHGTVSKKTSIAQNAAVNEQFIEDIMLRAYKECEKKIEIATMLHSSLKKVQSWKTTELEITRTNVFR